MISAQKLFTDHASHVVLHKLLEDSIKECEIATLQCRQNDTTEIEALSLSRKPLSDMPLAKRGVSATERVADQIRAIKDGEELIAKKRKLQIVSQYLRLYDTIMVMFTEREKWFVNQFFIQKQTMVQIIESAESPFYLYDRSSVWRFKKRLLMKADAMLKMVYEQKECDCDK